jgi:transcriptional regulator with XRE-family HTH domain
MSQPAVAKKLGIHVPQLSRLERGHATPKVKQACEIETLTRGFVKCHMWIETTPEPEESLPPGDTP